MKRKSIIASIIVLGLAGNVYATCNSEKDERDKFRNLCIPLAGLTTVLSYYGSSLIPISVGGVPLGNFAGVLPGLVAHNQCRIWLEKELNLAKCQQDRGPIQPSLLNVQSIFNSRNIPNDDPEDSDELSEMQRRVAKLASILSHYGSLGETAKGNYQSSVRDVMTKYENEGKDTRDPQIQQEFRDEVKILEDKLNQEMLNIIDMRGKEYDTV